MKSFFLFHSLPQWQISSQCINQNVLTSSHFCQAWNQHLPVANSCFLCSPQAHCGGLSYGQFLLWPWQGLRQAIVLLTSLEMVTVNVASLTANHAWQTWLTSMMWLQFWWMREDRLTSSTWTCAKYLALFPLTSLSLNGEARIWWMDHSVNKELAGWSNAELQSMARCSSGDWWRVMSSGVNQGTSTI